MRRWLPELAWDKPVSVLMAFLALLVIGGIAWVRIPVQMMPGGFELNLLWVWSSFPDGSPREVDEDVVSPVMAQLGTIPGVSSIESRASNDSAQFGLEFHSSVDMDDAYNTVVDRMERAMPDLPEEVDRYGIWKYNPDDEPVVWGGVSFPDTVSDPYYVMTTIVQPRLERIPGVATMDTWGVSSRNLEIWWDRDQLFAHGINLGEVQGRLQSDNFQRPGGRIEDRGLVRHVRSLARYPSLDVLRSYPVKDDIVLEDIAQVGFVGRASASINRVDGKPGAAFAIKKESAANTVELAKEVQRVLAELSEDPRVGGAKFFTFFDQGKLIEESIDTLTNTALQGGLFAVLVLYVFLREWRMTLLIASSIPFALLITVGVLYFGGGSLNLLSLMGLMLAVGMVVDNGIVVVETIYRRRADGASLKDAAVDGTAEVNLAILLSTMTTMVVFLPLILMSENGQFAFFMGALGLPVVWALAASLVVALVFAPVATRFVSNAEIKPDPRWLQWLTNQYTSLLSWLLRRPFDAGVSVVALLVLTIALPMQNVDCSGGSDSNLNDFTLRFTVPPNASPSEREAVVDVFENIVEEHREEWGVTVYRSRLSGDSNNGRLFVYLDEDGPMSVSEVMEAAKKELPNNLAGVEARIGWDSGGGGGGKSISMQVNGEDMATLDALAEETVRRVEQVPGVMVASVDYASEGVDELRLVVQREAIKRYGLDAATVGRTVSFAMRSQELPPYFDGDREINIRSMFALEDRQDIETLRDFGLWSPTLNTIVPVRAVTDVEVGKGPGTIRRRDGRTSLEIQIELLPDASSDEMYGAVTAALTDMKLPRGYTWTWGRERDAQADDDASLQLALLLSISFVFLLMGVLFESFLLPLCVITTIPMAMFGAFWGLWLTNTPFDLMAGVGLVILVGVIVNNGIVLIDLVTQLRADGMPRTEALVEAGHRRLRPILMTALTTIFGLAPMALGDSAFVGIPYAPLGRVVMSGLVAGTLLTLVFVPWLYAILDDLRNGAVGWAGFIRGRTGKVVS